MPDNKLITSYRLFLLLSAFCLAFSGKLFPQSKPNLEVFYSLADSSMNMFIRSENPKDSVYIELTTGSVYSIFNNHLFGIIQSKGIRPLMQKGTSATQLLYSIEKVTTSYGDIFRDGFLGTYLVKRELAFKGNYFYSGKGLKVFNLVYSDTVKVDDIKNLENSSFSFTVGAVPAEPFFSGLFEPVAALGTAAAAVILFFTVRSK